MDRFEAQDEKAAAESRLARRRERVEERRAEVRRFFPVMDAMTEELFVEDVEEGCVVAGPFEDYAQAADTAAAMEEGA